VGMAPLLQMITLPICGIKIDGSIIQELPHNPRAESLIRSLFLFCQSSDLTVTCEYVTTIELWQQLRAIAYDFPYLTVFVQGAAVGATEPTQ
ncbi:MAG TPA: EAL domain-containing protein, partial [Coleofasciculaceae cyanobacterium]